MFHTRQMHNEIRNLKGNLQGFSRSFLSTWHSTYELVNFGHIDIAFSDELVPAHPRRMDASMLHTRTDLRPSFFT